MKKEGDAMRGHLSALRIAVVQWVAFGLPEETGRGRSGTSRN